MKSNNRGRQAVLTPGGYKEAKNVKPISKKQAVFSAKSFFDVRNKITSLSAKEMIDQDLTITPGGYRSRSLVHAVDPGTKLKIGATKIEAINNVSNKSFSVHTLASRDQQILSFASGWVAYAHWYVENGNLLQRFETSWKVPPEPQVSNRQTIFLFNGIQDTGSVYSILQPVLQWGGSAAGGGPYWAIGSWYVSSNGQAFYTPLTKVSAGDIIKGIMSLTGVAGNRFSYNCAFEGFPNSLLTVDQVNELIWCNETLEAYAVDNCSELPAIDRFRFYDIGIHNRGGSLPSWIPVNSITDCGQHCNILNPYEVEIYFR